MYKLANGISPPDAMNEIFQSIKINHYQLRHISQFIVYSVHNKLNTVNQKLIVTKILIRFLFLISSLNSFTFKRFHSLPKMGCTMGTICPPNYNYISKGKFERILIYLIHTVICELLLSIYRQSILVVERKRERTFRFHC